MPTVLVEFWEIAINAIHFPPNIQHNFIQVPMYMRNSAAAIIMYESSRSVHVGLVDKWAEELRKCCGMADPLVVLIGNKCDLQDKRRVSSIEGQEKAFALDARFYEISAEKPITFALVLEDLCNDLLSSASAEEISSLHSVTRTDVVRLPSSSSSVSSKDSKAKTRCCAFL
ncbi:Ras family protein [Ostertagia ostertagi]